MKDIELPIRAATEVAIANGIMPDRCDILQNGSTVVLRLSEDLVARVVQDRDGPRKGSEWFQRETAVASYLTKHGAPIIPLHPGLPSGPYYHLGYPLNFWQFVTKADEAAKPETIGKALCQCHKILKDFPQPLPKLAILHETLSILDERKLFDAEIQSMLRLRLSVALDVLSKFPVQPLHGDAHLGNVMNTSGGVLWTDWEDTFSGPVEWDVASCIWNAKFLDNDSNTVDAILNTYGPVDETVLHACFVARAAVMTAWSPILYPNPTSERQLKLKTRIDWLICART